MKRLLALLAGLAGVTLAAQEAASTNKPPEVAPAGLQATAGSVSRRVADSVGPVAPSVPPGQVVTGGAIPKLTRSKQPLQMINPLAPKDYGDGTDVLARNPITGEAEGVTFLSFTCPERTAKPKTKKASPPPPTSAK